MSKTVKNPTGVWKYDCDKNKDNDRLIKVFEEWCNKGDECDCFKKMEDKLDGKFKYHALASERKEGINSNSAARLIWKACALPPENILADFDPPVLAAGWKKTPAEKDLAEGVKLADAQDFIGK